MALRPLADVLVVPVDEHHRLMVTEGGRDARNGLTGSVLFGRGGEAPLGMQRVAFALPESRAAAVATWAPANGCSPQSIDRALLQAAGELEVLVRELEATKAKPVQKTSGPPPPTNDYIAAAREAGREVLHHPRPLEILEDSLRGMGLGGSLAIPKTVFLAATTRILSAKLNQQAHLHVQGPASSGKSFEVLAALNHLPETAVIRFDGASPRALIYYEGDVRHCVILYSEMDGLPVGGEDGDAANVALTYLRTLCSEGRAQYAVVEKNKDGGMSTAVYEREGPAVVVVTGIGPIPDEQLRSRVHEVEVRVDRARIEAVLDAQGSSLAGQARAKVNPAIVAAQEYLQLIAPVDVHVPFAPELARLLFQKVKLADPRLSRELSRVTGFTAAHALLCIERRGRSPGGALLAELEDYAAAREVVRELSTSREYTKTAIEVWNAANELYQQKNSGRRQADPAIPVTASEIKKVILRDVRTVRRGLGELLAGGALVDRRSNQSRTALHEVVPSGEQPSQIPLPTTQELVALLLPPGRVSEQSQIVMAQEASLGTLADGSDAQDSSLTGNDLTPLGQQNRGVKEGDTLPDLDPTACPRCHSDSCPGDCCSISGKVYRVGDRLADGRVVLTVDGGIPTLLKRRSEMHP